ncbi:snRNA-activating protein complex subunit 3-like [Teleopsis dalmanni]|uniref:snRNA-activating protein complex subunit 3-like n=1 Tax=Teleopsis dalmanni TaxID=139649 RepID=UPI0018CF79B9|nr:snRNA-activating protein complex subunit 3-like [Teleopsis dalmanni]XP_037950323.1 snRNA-activating protein complex subunit 3-like [Teleopsis dalmanni]
MAENRHILEITTEVNMRPLISIKEFLNEYTLKLKNDFIYSEENSFPNFNMKKFMRNTVDDKGLEELEKLTDIEQLLQSCDEEANMGTESDSDFLSHQFYADFKATRDSSPFQRTAESYRMLTIPYQKKRFQDHKYFNEVIVTIRFYKPKDYAKKYVFEEEFQCLGSNLLCELRDKIKCICKKKRFFDISDDPFAELPDTLSNPAFFFITDTFYNDMRNPQTPDYSKVILEWAKEAKGYENFELNVKNMQDTRFLDLSVSFGFPQLYMHHGNCEHVFVFSQLDILTPNKYNVDPKCYPLLVSYNTYNNRICPMCAKQNYTFIVENSNRQLHDLTPLCLDCLTGFHYIDDIKQHNFNAYRVREIEDNRNGRTEDGNRLSTDENASSTDENTI